MERAELCGIAAFSACFLCRLLLFIFALLLILGGEEFPPGFLFILSFNGLLFSQLADSVGWAWKTSNTVRYLTTTNQGHNDGSADNEGENETVDAVPARCPTSLRGARVGVVEEVEDEELRDQSVLDGQEDGWPGERCRDDANGIARVALFTTVLGPFETPVDGAKEGDDLRSGSEGKYGG